MMTREQIVVEIVRAESTIKKAQSMGYEVSRFVPAEMAKVDKLKAQLKALDEAEETLPLRRKI